ncbi:hypothetical protein JOC77_001053 [Peribacillus deserti]|uniref:Uncharacterized protein n=1 Tax=Peribacillus deserti TaxID=673318 RepID=A0ABS2QH90_9BACI|nr:hypothetical protein [Peribacillus deserti]MBM7691646.1 hypothetical protein [Peribacillus deserti]
MELLNIIPNIPENQKYIFQAWGFLIGISDQFHSNKILAEFTTAKVKTM